MNNGNMALTHYKPTFLSSDNILNKVACIVSHVSLCRYIYVHCQRGEHDTDTHTTRMGQPPNCFMSSLRRRPTTPTPVSASCSRDFTASLRHSHQTKEIQADPLENGVAKTVYEVWEE